MSEVDQYILQYPEDIQDILRKIKQLVISNSSNVEELIEYRMPCYKTHKKPLIYFAAFKNHIGLYAIPSGENELKTNFQNINKEKAPFNFRLTNQYLMN